MAKKNRKTEAPSGPLSIRYELANLPSSQHRAGLAGLVIATRYLERTSYAGVCRVEDVTAGGCTFVVDVDGMRALFDAVYAATTEETKSPTVRKKKNGDVDPPIREQNERTTDPKTKKEKEKTVYFYPAVVPGLPIVRDLDPCATDAAPLWTKLLRDMMWNILRGVPATREPFDARAEKRATHDGEGAFEQLRNELRSVELPSTYYLGAMAKSAEDVPFFDRGANQFLLHFWPLCASVYVPQIETRDGVEFSRGFAIAVPDVADLDLFASELPTALRERSTEVAAYRPRAAVVSLPEEAALAAMEVLWSRLSRSEGRRRTADLVTGYDVVFAEKQGNSVKLLAVARVDADDTLIDDYAVARAELWDPLFRRVTIGNILHRRPWFAGFARALATVPVERVVGGVHAETSANKLARGFAHDVRIKLGTNKEMGMDEPKTLEQLVWQVVRVYLARKLKGRDLDWNDAKGNEAKAAEYSDKRAHFARGAFLAVRSRTNASDFREYFVATLCSTGQPMKEDGFHLLSHALAETPEDVRTLTMLALSAGA